MTLVLREDVEVDEVQQRRSGRGGVRLFVQNRGQFRGK